MHEVFHTALDSALCMQNTIYNQMAGHGWYAPEQAPRQKINEVKQKFASVQ